MNKIKAVVVWRTPAQLGDTLVSLPAFLAIKEKHKKHKIILLYTQSKNKGSVGAGNFIYRLNIFDEIIEYKIDRKTIQYLSKILGKYTISCSYYMTSSYKTKWQNFRDYMFMKLIIRSKDIRGMQTKLKTNEKETDRLSRIVNNKKYKIDFPLIKVGNQEIIKANNVYQKIVSKTRVIVMCTGSKMQAKKWPIHKYDFLIKHISTQVKDIAFIILGGEEDEKEARELIQGNKEIDIISICGKTTIMESAEIISRSCLYIGNDTGAMHLAAVMGIPCVVIFSAHNKEKVWEPLGKNNTIIRKSVTCEVCLKQKCPKYDHPCMNKITITEVMNKLSLNKAWRKLND